MEALRLGSGAIVATSILTGAMATGPLQIVAAAEDAPGVTDDTVVFGSFGTLNGPTYLFGELPMNGVEAVFREVNEAGASMGASSSSSARTTAAIRPRPSPPSRS
jgi:hypothetical protein